MFQGLGRPAVPVQGYANNDRPAASAFFSTRGPLDGPILDRQELPALSAISADGPTVPIGVAQRGGSVERRRGPATKFKLAVNEVELKGTLICIGRLGRSTSELLICGILVWSQVRRFGLTSDRVDESQIGARIGELGCVEMR
jgi:hypothetical protein